MSAPERLYLDHAATTPVLPEARAAIAAALEAWANPSSPHADGRKARAALEEARKTIADALGWRHDVIFAGATEAIQIVADRAKADRRIVGPTWPRCMQALARNPRWSRSNMSTTRPA